MKWFMIIVLFLAALMEPLWRAPRAQQPSQQDKDEAVAYCQKMIPLLKQARNRQADDLVDMTAKMFIVQEELVKVKSELEELKAKNAGQK